jgi:hypothetical protein
MPKPNPLTQGLVAQRQKPQQVPESLDPKLANAPVKAPVVPSRAGRVLIGAHFAPEVQVALKILAAEKRTTVQALLAQGIDMVFASYGKPQIAEMSASKDV